MSPPSPTNVVLTDTTQALLVAQLLRRAPAHLNVQVSTDPPGVTTTDARLARLLERLNTPSWVLLPFFGGPYDYWMLTATEPIQLAKAQTRLVRFLSPSYGHFSAHQRTLQPFDASQNELQRHAAALYSTGYYRWQSRKHDRSAVLDRIMLWLDMEQAEPRQQHQTVYTYRQLVTHFEEALASGAWEASGWALAEIAQRHLTTAENLLFLRLRMWAAQDRWAHIWNSPEFPTWAELTVPRPVRTLLLTACYREKLAVYEQTGQWADGIAAFGDARPRLGKLLSGPFQLEKPEVARLVAYQAVVEQDRARLALLEATDLDTRSRYLLEILQTHCPPLPAVSSATTPIEQAKQALAQQDFATAEQVIPTIADPDTRTLLFVELAFHTQDDTIGQRAWGAYQSLSFAQQEELVAHEQYVDDYLTSLKDRLLPATLSPEQNAPADEQPDAGPALRIWQTIGALELRLRAVIAARYQQRFGHEWEDKLHPDPALLQRWRDMQTRDRRTFRGQALPATTLPDYTYLEDLSGMILRQWELFQGFFAATKLGKGELADKITAVSRVRNPLAHNRPVPDSELTRAEVYCTELLTLLKEP